MRHNLIRLLKWTAVYAATALIAAFVTVRLTARGTPVTVPNLVGMDLKQVRQQVLERGLEMTLTGESWNEQYPAGCVIAQLPAPDTKVKRGRRVKLTVSRGSEIIETPRLHGMPRMEAEFLAKSLGLFVEEVDSTPSPAAKRTVIAQNPEPGTKVARGSGVRILLSDGPAAVAFALPNVTGEPTRQALAGLRELGLKIAEVSYVTSSMVTESTVIEQAPAAGFRMTPGDEVQLKAALGESGGQARYVSFNYQVPAGQAQRVRVIIIDETGNREVANEVEEGGAVVRLSTRVQGEAVAQIFLQGNLVEERRL